jgi:hypothetical protein
MIDVQQGAGLVLEDLLLDGQGRVIQGLLVRGGVLKVTNVTMQQFKQTKSGGAIWLDESPASITGATFLNNTTEVGGALLVRGNRVTLAEVLPGSSWWMPVLVACQSCEGASSPCASSSSCRQLAASPQRYLAT